MQKKKRKTRQIIYNILIAFFSVTFLVSAGYLFLELWWIPNRNNKDVNKYRNLYSSTVSTVSVISKADDKILDKFLPLLNENPDTAGWLTIEGTTLDNPVFYRPDDYQYYLKHTPEGEYNKLGSLFLGDAVSLSPQSKVLVMYGHNMEYNDELFGQLTKYKKLNFLQEHNTFTFDTIYKEGTWKIIGVIRASTNDADKHLYKYWTTNYSKEDFNAFLKESRLRSLYQIEDDATYDDDYLVFSTCEYEFWGDRLVILARRLRDGESAENAKNCKMIVNAQCKRAALHYELVGGSCPSDEVLEENYKQFYGEE